MRKNTQDMKEDKKYNDEENKGIDDLIRDSLQPNQTSDRFTESIMQKIDALDQKEEKALTSLMNKYVLESPAAAFSSKVMASIEEAAVASTQTGDIGLSKIKNTAIISKKAWVVILTLLTGFILYAMFSAGNSSAEPGIIQSFLSRADGAFSYELPAILTNPMLALSLFALSSLLLVDYVFRNRKLTQGLKSN